MTTLAGTGGESPSKRNMGIDQTEHREENQLAQTFKQLKLAHETSIMVYNKSGGDSNTKDLVRKYRPEFGEIYVFNDAKSCFSFVEAHNSDADHQKISLILLEADAVSVKILDFLSKRAVNKDTSSFPLIASVVLVPDTADDDVLRAIDGAGGANALVRLPASSAEILNTILDVLYRRRLVENMYTDLKVINQESRYPFSPVFIQEKPSLDRQATLKMKDSTSANRLAASASSGSLDGDDNGMNYIVSKNNDDWTECSTILPTYVKKFRTKEKKGKVPGSSTAAALRTSIKMTPSELLERAVTERFSVDAAIYNKLKAAAASADGDDDEAARLFDGDFLARGSGADLRADVDAGLGDEDLSTEDSDSEDDEHDDMFKDDTQSLTGAPKSDTVRHLLDPSRRPKWGRGNVAAHRGSSGSTQGSAVSATMLELEMRPFVERPVPNIMHKRTVGGIDKEVADKCWKVLLNKGVVTVETGIDARRDAKDDIIQDLHSGASSPTLSPRGGTSRPFAEASTSSRGDRAVDTLASAKVLKALNVDSSSHMDAPSPQVSRGGHARPLTSGSVVSGESKPTIILPATITRATRTLKRATKAVPKDVFVHNLLDVEMNNRKINMGDRELFERGLRHEAAHEDDSAIACYVRARKTSKDPQLPRMFLGAVYFKKELYLAALKQYDAAVWAINESRGGKQYCLQDDFVASYNRAVTYFRVGDDACGVADLARAVALRPQHMGAKRLMALVQRRMGDFDAAIANTVEMEAMRAKMKSDALQKRMEEEEKKEQEKEQEHRRQLLASRGSPSVRLHSLSQSSLGGLGGGVLETDGETEATDSVSAPKTARTAGAGGGGSGRMLPKITESPGGEGTQVRVARGSVVGIGEGSMASGGGSMAASHAHSLAARRKKGHPDLVHEIVAIRGREDASLAARTAKALSAYHVEKGGFDALNTFKAVNGYKLSLFESFFIRPNPLQEALGCRPKLRTEEQIDLIMTTLRLFPFLRKVSDEHLQKLSAVIEYRAVSTPSQLLSQNSPSDATVLLLRGTVEMRMEKPTHVSAAEDTVVGHVGEFSVFGHTDFLFRDDRSDFHSDLVAMLALEKIRLPKEAEKKLDELDHHHDDQGHGHHGHLGEAMHGHSRHGPSRHGSVVQSSHSHHGEASQSRRGSVANGGHFDNAMHSRSHSRHGSSVIHGHHNHGSSGRAMDAFAALATAGRILKGDNGGDGDEEEGLRLPLSNHRSSSLLIYGMSSTARRASMAMETARANGQDLKPFLPSSTPGPLGVDADIAGGDHDMATMQVLAAAKRRAVAPGMFLTYTMLTPCELLVVGDKQFDEYLRDIAVEEFTKTMSTVNACSIFESWSAEDRVRVARMSHVRTYKSGDLILKQGDKPSHLFIVVKGMVRAFKRPQEKEIFVAKLAALKQKALQFDTKYVYHHQLRNTLRPHDGVHPMRQAATTATARPHTSATALTSTSQRGLDRRQSTASVLSDTAESTPADPSSRTRRNSISRRRSSTAPTASFSTVKSHADSSNIQRAIRAANASAMFSEYEHMTAAEAERRQLAVEIAHYETLIEKATIAEAKEAADHERDFSTFSASHGSHTHGHGHGHGHTASEEVGGLQASAVLGKAQGLFDTSKLCEIATLQWPMIFGEACVVDPDEGLSRGTIVADTTTDVLVLHKKQIQTFHIDPKFIDKVKQKAVNYPDDTELVMKNRSKAGWKKVREAMMEEIPKGRWPSRETDVEPFVF